MRVLLVEDDPMLGQAVVQALRDASYAVDWLRDGQSASAALAHHGFAVILLDLGLPLRDGLDVLRDLRARDDSTPVLVITARDAVEQRIEGLDRGADDYLVKPFAVGELLARMRAWQAPRRRGGAGARQRRARPRPGVQVGDAVGHAARAVQPRVRAVARAAGASGRGAVAR